MMPFLKRVLVAAVLTLSLSPAQAWGACAWMLWFRDAGDAPDRDKWQRTTLAYDNLQECRIQADISNESHRRAVEANVKQHGPREFSIRLWHCFPDTVDPREPKGGTR